MKHLTYLKHAQKSLDLFIHLHVTIFGSIFQVKLVEIEVNKFPAHYWSPVPTME